MPEGDTIYRAAETLRKALLGRTVRGFESPLPAVCRVAEEHPVVGRAVSEVEARGKHLLIRFPSAGAGPELVLHTHLRMTGSWHIYRHGERWRKPQNYARVVLTNDEFVAPCFSAPVVELLTARQAERHPDLVSLGPDAIREGFDAAAAREGLRRRGDLEVGVALLNQRALAGVGNVYKSEVLFTQRVSPFARVRELDDATLDRLVAESHRLLMLNRENGVRRTLFGLREEARLWVYGRSGEPCRVCGEAVRMRRQGLDARSTYFCPQCQCGGAVLPAGREGEARGES